MDVTEAAAWPHEVHTSPGVRISAMPDGSNGPASFAHQNLGYTTTPFVPPARSPSTEKSLSPLQSPVSFSGAGTAALAGAASPPTTSAGQDDRRTAPMSDDSSTRPVSISGSSFSIPMSNRLTPAQLETVRSLMSAGVTGNDLTTLVRSMVEGENQPGPSQPGPGGDAPPPMYDFKDSSLR